MPVLEAVENAQDQLLDTLGTVQDRVVATNKKIAGQVSDALGDRVPELPTIPVLTNVANRIPSPVQAVGTYFDLVERATKANRKLALDLVGAWVPATTPANKTAAAKPAANKAAAPKSAAKKAAPAKKASNRTVAKAVSTDKD